MKTNGFPVSRRLRACGAVLAVAVIACGDLSTSAPRAVVEAEAHVAAAETAAEAWSRAYAWMAATEHPHLQLLMEHVAWSEPDIPRWEFVKAWNAEEAAGRLRPRLRCANAMREGIAAGKSVDEVLAEYGIPPTAQDTAVVRAMNGVADYLRGIVEGTDPSPWLLEDMRNLGLPGPVSSWGWMGGVADARGG